MRTSKRANGYTLIEVLVAMMILAMALTVLMRMFSAGLRTIDTSADYAHAALVAQSQLAATGLAGAITIGETYGSEAKFRWIRTVSEYRAGALENAQNIPLGAYRVTVVVEWPGRVSPRSLKLTTIKLDRIGGQT